MPKRLLLLATVVSFVVACADDPLTPAGDQLTPAFSHAGTHAFTGQMLGPDGASLCASLWDGALWRLTFADASSGAFQGQHGGFCPDDLFHMDLPSGGTYIARIALPFSADIGTLPIYSAMREPVTLDTDVARDIQVENGETLGGGVIVDGHPVGGAPLGLQFLDLPPNFAGPSAFSAGDRGPWLASYAPVPMYLQTGVGYRLTVPALVGVVALGPETSTELLFDGSSDLALRYRTSRAARTLSHDATRLTVTTQPGVFGGHRAPAEPPFGRGWGVQFPEAASHTGWSQLFDGGLAMHVNGRVLSAIDLDGYSDCAVGACRDMGLDATFRPQPAAGDARAFEWRYSDEGSAEAVGLDVVQHSFDGSGGDYVLFRFTVSNASDGPVTLNPGFFMDWDVDGNALDDVGDSPAEFGGRLVLVTNEWGGNVFGTLLVGAGATHTYFVANGTGFPVAEQLLALDGTLVQPDAPDARDWWYTHAGEAVTLAAGESTEFWVGLVAGESRADAIANAAAAEAEALSH